MNPHLSTIVCNSPLGLYGRIRGAGMTLRPAFYSGRGTYEGDVTSSKLAIIYDGIRAHEAMGLFPAGASDVFARMVCAIPILSGSAFLEALLRLDALDYQWDGILPTPGFAVATDDGTGAREAAAFFGIVALKDTDSEDMKRQSFRMKQRFLQEVGRADLLTLVPVSEPPVQQIWSCRDRT